ncbi:MAG: ornithine carbamoyltransferase [Candidatus Aenigmarchaeota archaeon]|nr:ornithine carbamoyltransferase [Candidatus Aenigmarchaeota archaeon]
MHILSVADLTARQIERLLSLAVWLKRYPLGTQLKGKTVALVFEKPSTRTRVSFETGIGQLQGQALYIDASTTQLSRGEPIKDFARVMDRYVDCIAARVFSHSTLEEIAKHSAKPVINMLSDLEHPCQTLADLLTIKEKLGRFKGVKVAYIGDGNNVCNSLMLGCALAGMDIAISDPPHYKPNQAVLRKAKLLARNSNASVTITASPEQAVKDADIIYTDTWISMGEEKEERKRLKVFRKDQVNGKLARHAKKNYLFMHPLPRHPGREVTDDVFESKHSIVFDQAENRLHVQKALLVKLLGRW